MRRQPLLMPGQKTNNFRRSRTLTTVKSSKVNPTSIAKSALKSDRLKKQSLRAVRRLLLIGLIGLVGVISGLYYLLSQYVGSVRVDYAASRALAQKPPSQHYAKAILEYLGARPAERFRFALKPDKLTAALRQKYPEVNSVESRGGGLGESHFIVSFRQPTVSWQVGDKQYFVDANGETFEKNYFRQPAVSVKDNSGAAVSQGSSLVSKGFLRFLGRLDALARQTGLSGVSEASLPLNTTREIDIKLEGRGYLIKTHTERDPAAEIEDIQRVIGYLEQHKINPSYIDVRVPGRAYYK